MYNFVDLFVNAFMSKWNLKTIAGRNGNPCKFLVLK